MKKVPIVQISCENFCERMTLSSFVTIHIIHRRLNVFFFLKILYILSNLKCILVLQILYLQVRFQKLACKVTVVACSTEMKNKDMKVDANFVLLFQYPTKNLPTILDMKCNYQES